MLKWGKNIQSYQNFLWKFAYFTPMAQEMNNQNIYFLMQCLNKILHLLYHVQNFLKINAAG